jgi:hypothetical protein
MVDKRRNDQWLKEWIVDPETHMKNADIEYYRDNEYESEIKNDDWDSGSADSRIRCSELFTVPSPVAFCGLQYLFSPSPGLKASLNSRHRTTSLLY